MECRSSDLGPRGRRLFDCYTGAVRSEVGQTYGRGQPDISGANDGNGTHILKSVTKGIERISHYAGTHTVVRGTRNLKNANGMTLAEYRRRPAFDHRGEVA